MAITSLEQLEAVVGRTPPQMDLKVINHLDPGAIAWIVASPLLLASIVTAQGVRVTLGGGTPGFAVGETRHLHVRLGTFDNPTLAVPGAPFGGLFLIPGIGETLRVNGRIDRVDDLNVRIVVHECYGHCAKALIRSQLWEAEPAEAPTEPEQFVAASRFLALATTDPSGHADLSPKGDPAGAMAQLDGETLWFADRPGNRRVDSFKNLIDQPHVAMALIVPGSPTVALVTGRATLTADADARERFAVQNKCPALVVRVELDTLVLRRSPTLARTALWPAPPPPQIDPAKLFVEHIRLNRDKGLAASLSRAALSVPGVTGLLKKALDKDYRDNLY